MKRILPRALSLLLALSLLAALTVSPALASEAMGDGLTATDTLLNRETQLSTNVFWSAVSSDYRTENLITYTPNASVTPIVTYGGALTDRSSVSNTAKALEGQGWRVVAGINGDFYNVNTGLPIGIVVTQGQLRSSDGGYHAIGFRSDGAAILGKPAVTMSVRYTAQDGTGEPLYNEAGEPLYDELGNPLTNGTGQLLDKSLKITAFNKARTESGVYLYTYDFNASHTTGSTQPGVDVVCTVQEGNFALGGTTSLLVERVVEAESSPTLAPNQAVLTANAKTGIPLFREGRNLVDLTSVENVALACELSMTAEKAPGRAFNITNGEPMEFRNILEQFLRAIGEEPRYRRLPFGLVYALAGGLEWLYRTLRHAGEPPLTRYTVCTLGYAQTMDISSAREILGYVPEKTLAESIREYGAWWKANHGTGSPKGEEKSSSKRTRTYPASPDCGAEAGRRPGAHNPTQPDQPHLPAPPGKVEEVKIYPCGSCTNRLGIMFRGMRWEKREFPARAALIRHRELGHILYDTGYSEEIFRGGPGLWLYRLLNPVRLGKEEGICERLKKDGIPPETVKTILLSHAHPDHIGGLSRFPGCRLVAFGETLKALERVRNLVFRNLLPPKGCIEKRNTPGNPLENHFLNRYFGQAYDLFGDGSAIAVRLEGHTRGQMGLWIPDVSLFLAADACWGLQTTFSMP